MRTLDIHRMSPIKRLLEVRPFRYILTGGALFLIDLTIFLACTGLFGLDVRLSQVISRTAGAIVGFFGHKYFSFRSSRSGRLRVWAAEGGAYTLITLFNIAFSPFVVYAALSLVGGGLIAGKVIAEVFLVVETYLLLQVVFVARGKEACE